MNILNPRYVLAVLLVLAALVGVVYYVFHVQSGGRSTAIRVSLVSPSGQNRIELREAVEEIASPTKSRNAVVRFTLFNNGTRIINDEPLVVDSPDLQFFSRYSKQLWVSDSTLRFVQSAPPREPQRGELLVVNETGKEISYLRIIAGDIFLLMHLPAKSTIRLDAESVSLPNGELSYIASKGRFSDGDEISEQGANFNTRGKYANPAHYSIVIRDAGVSISSAEFDRHPF